MMMKITGNLRPNPNPNSAIIQAQLREMVVGTYFVWAEESVYLKTTRGFVDVTTGWMVDTADFAGCSIQSITLLPDAKFDTGL